MKKIIHSLRNKPDHVKSRYVFVFSIIATVGIVVLLGFVSFSVRSHDTSVTTENPFQIFGNIFSTTLKEINTQVSENKNQLNQITQQSNEIEDTEITPEPDQDSYYTETSTDSLD